MPLTTFSWCSSTGHHRQVSGLHAGICHLLILQPFAAGSSTCPLTERARAASAMSEDSRRGATELIEVDLPEIDRVEGPALDVVLEDGDPGRLCHVDRGRVVGENLLQSV